jgi:hypothetical protein
MFIERKDKSLNGYESDKSNKLLLDNIQEHLTLLHDQEIILTREESDRFTRQIVARHKNLYPYHCPIAEYKGNVELVTGINYFRSQCAKLYKSFFVLFFFIVDQSAAHSDVINFFYKLMP